MRARFFGRGNRWRGHDEIEEQWLQRVRDYISVESIRVKCGKKEGTYSTVLEAFLERKGIKPQILLLGCFLQSYWSKRKAWKKGKIPAVLGSAGAAAWGSSGVQGSACQPLSVGIVWPSLVCQQLEPLWTCQCHCQGNVCQSRAMLSLFIAH